VQIEVSKVKDSSKIIGYFAYYADYVFCEGEACIISNTEELMKSYLSKAGINGKRESFKQARFGEILNGLSMGAVYAFDKPSFEVFSKIAKIKDIDDIGIAQHSSEILEDELQFVRVHLDNTSWDECRCEESLLEEQVLISQALNYKQKNVPQKFNFVTTKIIV